jgi:hypothetical protein
MIGRAIWFTAIAAMGLVTSAVQLDRETVKQPGLASLVPEPMRGSAQARITIAALQGNDSDAALDEARKLVRRRPIPAEHLTILAAAQLKAGQPESASLTIQLAAHRGWREPLAQEIMLRLALEAGDPAEAARRYAALFVQPGTSSKLLTELGEQILTGDGSEGRDALVEIVSATQRWHSHFLQRGIQVMPPNAFAEITVRSMERGASFDCGALSQAIEATMRRDRAAGEALRSGVRNRCGER